MDIEEEKDKGSHLLPENIKYAIVFYKDQGDMNDKEIKRRIEGDFGRTLGNSTVKAVWDKYQETDSISNRWSHEGRPRSLGQEDRDLLIQTARQNRLSSALDLKNELNLPVSRETVNRELLEKGYKAYRSPARPLLKAEHIEARYAFADVHKNWKEWHWRRVIFTDESPFRLVNPSGRIFVRRMEEEELESFATQASVPSSSMVMVWGAISDAGPGPLIRVEGTIGGDEYLDLFRFRLRRYYPGLYDRSLIFQDDNATSHTADVVEEWFQRYGIRRLNWPARSPDMNIIEDVWNKMKYEMRGEIFTSQNELWKEIQAQWSNLSIDFINDLYASLPERIQALREAGGGHTKF